MRDFLEGLGREGKYIPTSWCTRKNFSIELMKFVQKIESDFAMHGIDEDRLKTKTYTSIIKRITLEETNASLSENTQSGKSRFAIFNGPGKS